MLTNRFIASALVKSVGLFGISTGFRSFSTVVNNSNATNQKKQEQSNGQDVQNWLGTLNEIDAKRVRYIQNEVGQ